MFTSQIKVFLQTVNGDKTRRSYEFTLHEFARWYHTTYGQPPDAALLTDQEVRDWRSHLLTVRHLSASSVNVRLAALRGLVRQQGRLLRVQGAKRVVPPVEPLNGREVGRLTAAVEGPTCLEKRNVAILSLLVRTGLRVGELVKLRDEDLNLGQRKGQVVVRQGKGLKERTVPVNAQARTEVQAYLDVRPTFNHTTLFISRTGEPLSSRDVQRLVVQATREAGLSQRVTPHTLRHSFATRALREKKIDLATLSQLLGHANLTTTARYLHPDQAQVAEMLEDL